MVTVSVGREHELVRGGGESAAYGSVQKIGASIVKENLLGCHVVAVENGGKDAVLFVETQLFPVEPLFTSDIRRDIRGRKSAARARASVAAGGARRAGRGATRVASAGAAVVAQLFALSITSGSYHLCWQPLGVSRCTRGSRTR